LADAQWVDSWAMEVDQPPEYSAESWQARSQNSTENKKEVLVFLYGQGELLIGENGSFQVGQDKVSYIPPHTGHDVKNTGTEPLVYIYCVAPVVE